MKSTRTIKKKLNEEQMISEIESLNPIKPQSEKKPTIETPNEKLIEPRWKGSLPIVFMSEEEKQARSAENIKKMDNAGPGKRFGETLYTTNDSYRGRIFRLTYQIDERSDDEALMSTGLYVKLTQ